MADPEIAAAEELVRSLAPAGQSVEVSVPLTADESEWFLQAKREQIVEFIECPSTCFRFKKWGVPGPDHFVTPSGKARHLFSKPVGPHASLNREYIPHIAAFAYAILDHHYDRTACSFSRYRKFSRDLIAKKAGTAYETDAEFYDGDQVHLQIEAKASEKQTTALARAFEGHGTIDDLPASAAKEVEYVLDLAPRYLWVVGPGSIDPPRHVYMVELLGPLNAAFNRVESMPPPPR